MLKFQKRNSKNYKIKKRRDFRVSTYRNETLHLIPQTFC